MTTTQEYIDIIFKAQCCLGNLVNSKSKQKYIGFDCKTIDTKIKTLNAILRVLLRQGLDLYNLNNNLNSQLDLETCLNDEEINCLIEKVKVLCADCCIDTIERVE